MSVRSETDISQAAALILDVWKDPHRPLPALPESLRPENLAHAYAIQQAVSRGLGAIGAWIVWDSIGIGSLISAPLPLSDIHLNGVHLSTEVWSCRRVVPCVCLRVGTSLPNYRTPYSREQIIAAVESCHAAIAVQQPRFSGTDALDPLTELADGGGYAGLVYNQRGVSLQNIDLSRIEIRTTIGSTKIPASTLDPGLDIIEALRWLANDGSWWAGGLMVGHLVAAPIRADETEAPADAAISVALDGIGRVDLQFGGNRKMDRHR